MSEQQTGGAAWRVDGRPTNAELAAVVAAVTAAAAAAGSAPAVSGGPPSTDEASGWSAYWRGHRAPLPAGPGAWLASGQPPT